VPEGTACASARADGCYCSRCDLLVGLDGFHVIGVEEFPGRRGSWLRVEAESPPREEGCRSCGVLAHSHGRRTVRLIDTPCFGRPVELVWRKRTWRCREPKCEAGSLIEQNAQLARPQHARVVSSARRARPATLACSAAVARWHATDQGPD
jgi:transposase